MTQAHSKHPPRLEPAFLAASLQTLPGWVLQDSGAAIAKTFRFKDFNEAFGFMTRVAILADKLDHHPEWLNVYNRVNVTLTTHDVGGVSLLDIEMATFMDEVAAPAHVA